MFNYLALQNRNILWPTCLLSFLLFGLTITMTGLLTGCGECRYDTDCTGSGLCTGGQCTHLKREPPPKKDGGGVLIERPPVGPCLEGEIRPCYRGAQQTKAKGQCKPGKQTCTGAQWSTCVGDVTPTAEVCDGKDNDCNGTVDDNIPGNEENCFIKTLKGPCGIGKKQCSQGQMVCAQIIQPKAEVCGNGEDDDCDGQTDENPPCKCAAGSTQDCYTGASNTRRIGNCKDGKQTCNTKQEWGACLGDQKPSNEICDNQDNDCNGQTDDGLHRPCGITKGICLQGKQTCSAGQWSQTCTGEIKGSPEVCDGKDNNCDGFTDENLTRGCTTQCGPSTQACANGSWGTCIPPNHQKETCNNKDDDCDGKTDELLTQPCKNSCGAGRETCDRGQWINCNAPKPITEFCDGKDNDCDGKTDETSGPEIHVVKNISKSLNIHFASASNGSLIAVIYSFDKDVYFARFERSGKYLGQVLLRRSITSTPLYLQLFWTGKNFGAFWRTYRYNSTTRKAEYTYEYARISSTGVKLSNKIFPVGENSVIRFAWNGSSIGTTWRSYDSSSRLYQIRFLRLSETGAALGSEVLVNTASKNYTSSPSIAVAGSHFGLIWSQRRNSVTEIYFQRLSSTGSKSGPEVAVSRTLKNSGYQQIAGNGNYFVVAYSEDPGTGRQIYTCYLSRWLSTRYTVTQITRSTKYPSNLTLTSTSSSSIYGEMLLSWTDSITGRTQLYTQRLTNKGQIRLGSYKFQVSKTTSYVSLSSTAPLSKDIYGIFWRDARTGNSQLWFRSLCGL